MQLTGKRVLVVGLGRSGRAAARLCLDRGAEVTLTDLRRLPELEQSLAQLASRCSLQLGGHQTSGFAGADLIVLSPGVPPIPELDAARAAGVPIVGEVELASQFVSAPMVGITGTNGKSTTTMLVAELLRKSGRKVFCGGNLGQPLSEAVGSEETGSTGVVVLELSSFQLETVHSFQAHVAALLNVSQDHLDRYPSYAAYQQAKARVFERQTERDFAVLPGGADQAHARALAGETGATQLVFDVESGDGTAAWLEGETLCVRVPGATAVERYARAALRLPGRHNTLNALSALLVARLAGATEQGCRSGLAGFTGLPHRMQLVRERDGVRFYDDSKATNVGAVVGSLTGFDRPVVLIAGGKDKGGDYQPLREVVSNTCRGVILIGAAAQRMHDALADTVPVLRAESLQRAVADAAELALSGDAVVLSPACSSFDMFRDYEERGRAFAAVVGEL